MTKKKYILIFVLALFSCNQHEPIQTNIKPNYFDLKGYFEKEIQRLTKKNPIINKRVNVNGETEQKKLKVENWDKELAIFVNADINKASWSGSFTHSKTDTTDLFVSDSKKISVKQLAISKKGSVVSKIKILVENKNILFHSIDTLTYYPDSLYEIKKSQKIRLLNEKRYIILGKF